MARKTGNRKGGPREGQLCSLPKMQKSTAALRAPPGTFGCFQMQESENGTLVEARTWQLPQSPEISTRSKARTASMNRTPRASELKGKLHSKPLFAPSDQREGQDEATISRPVSAGRCKLNEAKHDKDHFYATTVHPHAYRPPQHSGAIGDHTQTSAANAEASLPLLDPTPLPSSSPRHESRSMTGNRPISGRPLHPSTPTQALDDASLAFAQMSGQGKLPVAHSSSAPSAGGPVRRTRTRHRVCPVQTIRDVPQTSDIQGLHIATADQPLSLSQQLLSHVPPQHDEALSMKWPALQHHKSVDTSIIGGVPQPMALCNEGYGEPNLCQGQLLPCATSDCDVSELLCPTDILAAYLPISPTQPAVKSRVSTFSTLASALDT
ncbi:hypothetical protein PYCCODRAFT_1475775 [Trametes coccinea BRFM310]|uniref:Uncharacterized protein n=1 Tax=Trametes coccinea (strain BRFM310) TaxID=1353009 RepID=A0A1Y2IU61_TRAC3|nr:hypothetical protein PYCCODRAFT_1475775 [Trametes coccinea BRFM310]